MPSIVTTTVFTVDELSDAAKENARSWYRERGLFDEWYDYIFDDFETICRIIGITLETQPVRLYGGGTREQPKIWFQGFWSQSDGACYEGYYSHARGAAKAIRAHAPKDTELHAIVDALQDAQRRNFWQLHSTVRQTGRHPHASSLQIDVERDSPTWQPIADGTDHTVVEALRDLAHWLYHQLRDYYEAETSDCSVDEALAINEWTFTKDGKRFGCLLRSPRKEYPAMTETAARQMVLRMTVDAADATPFSTIQDADDFANCELRGFHFHTIIIAGRILLFKQNGGYFSSIGLEPAPQAPTARS